MLVELSEVICPKRSVWLNEPLGKDFRPIMAIFYLPDDASKCKHDPTKQLRLDIYIYDVVFMFTPSNLGKSIQFDS